ncbi:MAG: hypothetical protein IPI43_29035 [Sandaracinaceae bacterium]|nr:hypothetical protein [Sandaracinaceae bacterium]
MASPSDRCRSVLTRACSAMDGARSSAGEPTIWKRTRPLVALSGRNSSPTVRNGAICSNCSAVSTPAGTSAAGSLSTPASWR